MKAHQLATFPLRFAFAKDETSFPFSVAVDANGRLVAAVIGEAEVLLRRASLGSVQRDGPLTRAVRSEVEAYAAGKRREFTVPLAPLGSVFQHRVWAALGRIPFGQTRSYGDLARELGSSPRAVGRANATNPICLVVPCHRVIGADGSLTGFAFGEAAKRALLTHETRSLQSGALVA